MAFYLEENLSDNYSILMKKSPTQNLIVDNIEYPNIEGADTIPGYYKNGWDILVNDNMSKLTIYTSYEKKIAIERVFIFKKNIYNDWCLVQTSTYGIFKKVDEVIKQFANDYILLFLRRIGIHV